MRKTEGKARGIHFAFLMEYARHFKEVGSVVPDSAVCLRRMVERIPFDTADTILEFGAGSGTVTREILKRKRPDTRFFSFEKNAVFYQRLKGCLEAENFHALQRDVFRSPRILGRELGDAAGAVDCILSTLPCSSIRFEELVRSAVLPLLKPGGCFIQYMHTLSVLKGFRAKPFLQGCFSQVETDLVWRNIPPVFIYACYGPKSAA